MSDFKLRISVKGLFFNSSGEVLLVKGSGKSLGQEYWATPGGGLEEGEDIKSALERELTEETGYFGKAKNLVHILDIEFEGGRRQLELFLTGKIDESREPIADNIDHEFKFFSKDEFNKTIFLPDKLNPFDIKESIEVNSVFVPSK